MTIARAPAAAGLAAAAIIVIGFAEGAFVAGGSDSYGYVSQAHLWAAGTVAVDEPIIRELDQIVSPEAAAPLGYTLTVGRGAIVPTYSPGYPLLMAAFELAAGRRAVFWVVPLMAGLLVWATFLLGRAVGGPVTGLSASAVVGASPAVLFHVTTPPMSDVPGAAWWTLALALLPRTSIRAAAGCGLAVGAAVLTRPNLAPLAAIPFAVLAWPILATRRVERASLHRAGAYLAGVAPACLGIAAVNTLWYGSPLISGYGSLSNYYRWEYWAHNIVSYPAWLFETQTPAIALALVAPFVLWKDRAPAIGATGRRVFIGALAIFALATLAAYIFYRPFDSWIHLRFILPALPVLIVFMCAVLAAVAARLPSTLAAAAMTAVVGLLVWHGYAESRARNVFLSETERKYALVGEYARWRLPQNAVVITNQHSGSVRYYSGRTTLMWQYIDPTRLDEAIVHLRERGRGTYLLLEEWEVGPFKEKYQGSSRLGALDWPAAARLPLGNIQIFRAEVPPSSGLAPPTETIPDP